MEEKRRISKWLRVWMAMLAATVVYAQEEIDVRRAAGTESSEAASGLYTTRLEDGTHSTELGKSVGAGAASGAGWGAAAGEKGFAGSRRRTVAGQGLAYSEYGATTGPGTAAVIQGQQSQVRQPAGAPREGTQTLLGSQTNRFPVGQPGAGTAVGTPRSV